MSSWCSNRRKRRKRKSTLFAVFNAYKSPKGVVMTPAMRFVLAAIANHCDLDSGAFPSLETLAHMTGFDRRTISRTTKALEGGGYITRRPIPPTRPGAYPRVAYSVNLEALYQGHHAPSGTVSPGAQCHVTRGTTPLDQGHHAPLNSEETLIETMRGARGGATHPAPGREGSEGRVVAPPSPTPPATPSPPLRLELPAARSSKAARPAKPPHPRHREVFRRWLELHEHHYGDPPATGGSEGGRLAKSVSVLLEKFSGDADRVLACLERSVLDRRQPTLHAIASNPDGFRPLAPAKVVPIQPKPGRYTYAGLTDPRQLEAAL